MRTFFSILLTSWLAAPAWLAAEDVVGLSDGSTIRGTVRGIQPDGRVVVESPLSPAPLYLRGESLRSIKFELETGSHPGHSELVRLVNGDVLPGALRGFDADAVELQTWYAGEVRVERRFVKSIDFGVTPQKLVYNGPNSLAEWINNSNWSFDEDSRKLVCDASGSLARPDILPKQFILRFRIEWESNPNFKIYFCDDYLKRTGNADRYYFEINSAGLQLKRQTEENSQRWVDLANSNRRPEEFPGRFIDVEIRVDRESRLIYLYLNGEKLGRYPDPIAPFPAGTGIMLYSQAGGELKNIISQIEIYEWDAVTQLRRSEGHDDPDTDAIVDVNGEHISGRALRLEEEDGTSRLVFESPYSDELLAIRTTKISSLYLRSAGDPPAGGGPVHLALRGGGKLRLNSPSLGEDTLSARHPLLGDLRLQRAALNQLSVSDPDEEQTEPDP